MTRKSKRNQAPQTFVPPPKEQREELSSWSKIKKITAVLSPFAFLITIVLIIFNGGFYFGGSNTQTSRNSDDIKEVKRDLKDFSEKTTSALQGISTQLGRLEERITNLELRDKATAAGLKDPNIVPVRLSEPSPPITNKPNEKTSYSLRFTIKELTRETIRFSMDGEIRSIDVKDVNTTLPFQIGVPINLMSALKIQTPESSEAFSIWLVILEVHTNNTAVIAIGPKTTSPATNIG